MSRDSSGHHRRHGMPRQQQRTTVPFRWRYRSRKSLIQSEGQWLLLFEGPGEEVLQGNKGARGMYPTWMMRDGFSDTRLSKMLRSLDIDKETISSPSVHVPPTCWLSIPGPSDHDVTSLLASTSPRSIILRDSFSNADVNPPTESNGRVGRGSH